MRPFYQDDAVTLYHGDARDVLPALAADSADVILTDPPYGVGKAAWDDAFPLWWLDDAARIAPVLAVTPGTRNLLALPPMIGRLRYRWTLAAHLVNGMTHGDLGYANWIACLIWTADDVSLYRRASDAARIVVGRDPKPDHPSPKPYEAVRWFLSCLPGGTVLDPFAGSGTTLRAAKDLGRKSIGVEIDESYCRLIAKRMAQSVMAI